MKNQLHIATTCGATLTIDAPGAEYFDFQKFTTDAYELGFIQIPNILFVPIDKVMWISYGIAGEIKPTFMPATSGRPN